MPRSHKYHSCHITDVEEQDDEDEEEEEEETRSNAPCAENLLRASRSKSHSRLPRDCRTSAGHRHGERYSADQNSRFYLKPVAITQSRKEEHLHARALVAKRERNRMGHKKGLLHNLQA